MKIVITGSKGQLGNALQELLKKDNSAIGKIPAAYKGCEIFPVDVDTLDISDSDAVNDFISKIKPRLIINCAAMTNVDGCETNLELADKVNAIGPKNLAIAAANTGAKLVQISTDYVFKGDATTPYIETDECDPVTAYGSSKLKGEINVLENCKQSYILRTSWLYGLIGSNFVKTIRRVAKEKGG